MSCYSSSLNVTDSLHVCYVVPGTDTCRHQAVTTTHAFQQLYSVHSSNSIDCTRLSVYFYDDETMTRKTTRVEVKSQISLSLTIS